MNSIHPTQHNVNNNQAAGGPSASGLVRSDRTDQASCYTVFADAGHTEPATPAKIDPRNLRSRPPAAPLSEDTEKNRYLCGLELVRCIDAELRAACWIFRRTDGQRLYALDEVVQAILDGTLEVIDLEVADAE